MTTLVIAIDGMDPDYLQRGLEADMLPTFRNLIECGVWGPLRSTIPPISSPAWICFRTGKNPGQLGFVDFFAKKEASYEIELADFKVPDLAIWQILSYHGKRVGVVAVHLTYPPDRVNGIMVSPVYARSDAYTYPTDAQADIEARIGRLDYEVRDKAYFANHLEEEHLRLEGNRLKLAQAVWARGEYDFFICGFNLDRAQHFTTDEELLLKLYQNTDRIVGELLDTVQPANVLLVSDHGGGSVRGVFFTNQWLTEQGYMAYRGPRIVASPQPFSRESIRLLLDHLGLLPLARRLVPHRARRLVPAQSLSYEMVLSDIDWSHTVAFSPVSGGIYLNVKGREPEGIISMSEYEEVRDQIIGDLKAIRDPATGSALEIVVFRREELFSGAKVESLPDISFFAPFYPPRASWGAGPLGAGGRVGDHRLHGIFIASGQDVRSGEVSVKPSIVDVAPTLLHLMGVPVSEEMDGSVLDIFRAESEPGRCEPTHVAYDLAIEQAPEEGDEEAVRERLRALGYID